MNTTHLEINLQIMYMMQHIMHFVDLHVGCKHNHVVNAVVEIMMNDSEHVVGYVIWSVSYVDDNVIVAVRWLR